VTRSLRAFAVVVFLASTVAGRSSAQELSFENRPALTFGDTLRVELTARMQGDVRDASPGAAEGGFDLHRRRVGVKGTLTRHVEFEVERELNSSWRDAFVNLRTFRPMQLRAGQFKMPFSLEQLTSASSLDFVYRSRAAETLAPGRSIGASLHGRLAGRTIGYDGGVFIRDGENARFGANPGAGQTVAGRVTFRLPQAARRSTSLADVEVGVGATTGDVPEGRYSLRGRLTSRDTFFSPVFVSGRRIRAGADVAWRPGPFGVRAEILRADDERRGQGLRGETLPRLRSEGWHATATWAVAGRRARTKAEEQTAPAGVKGLELAVRAEGLTFGSVDDSEPQLRNPRAANLAEARERAWTFGVNWTLNRWIRVQVNAIREELNDTARGASAGPGVAWTHVGRLQFAM
jgi:phosphate-selective porin